MFLNDKCDLLKHNEFIKGAEVEEADAFFTLERDIKKDAKKAIRRRIVEFEEEIERTNRL